MSRGHGAVVKPRKGQLVVVRWRDAHSSGGWTDLRDHPKDAVCNTVGYVVRKDSTFLTVAAHRWEGKKHPAPGSVGDPISIPWAIVLGWSLLEETTID